MPKVLYKLVVLGYDGSSGDVCPVDPEVLWTKSFRNPRRALNAAMKSIRKELDPQNDFPSEFEFYQAISFGDHSSDNTFFWSKIQMPTLIVTDERWPYGVMFEYTTNVNKSSSPVSN